MNTRVCVAALVAFYSLGLYAEPLGTGFTYQGELKQAGQPADGVFDFQFGIYDMSNGGISVVPEVQLEDVTVADGIFSVELDFGAEVFDGTQYWIGVGVREGASGGGFTSLTPRQKLTATPYSLHSLNTTGSSEVGHEFLGFSTETSGGNAGIANMLYWCQLDFPGSRVCTTTDFANWSTRPDAATLGINGSAWINVEEQILGEASSGFIGMDAATGIIQGSGAQTYTHVSLNCSGWTDSDANVSGTRLSLNSTSGSVIVRLQSCDTISPVACCTAE